MLPRCWLSVLVVAGCWWASAASAQPAGAQAEVLFREGRGLMAKGKFAEACASFEQSQKLDPVVTTLLNLANCREKNNQLATAWGLFLEAERQTRAKTEKAMVELHKVAHDRAAKLEPRVSKLTVHVSPENQITGLEIVRDNEQIETVMWNRALPVDGGTYTITARAPGMDVWSTHTTVAAEADAKSVEIPKLHPLPNGDVARPHPAPPPEEPTKQAPPADRPVASSGHALPLALGAGGIALGGAAVGLELWARSTYSDAKAEMTSQTRRDSLEHSANTRRYLGEGLAVGGVACIGIAVVLYLRSGGEPSSPIDTSTRLNVSPTGVAISGTF